MPHGDRRYELPGREDPRLDREQFELIAKPAKTGAFIPVGRYVMRNSVLHVGLTAIAALCVSGFSATAAWEPVRPVEFVVPAGTGGGADQMARTIQGIVTKHNLMKQPLVVINRGEGAGGAG